MFVNPGKGAIARHVAAVRRVSSPNIEGSNPRSEALTTKDRRRFCRTQSPQAGDKKEDPVAQRVVSFLAQVVFSISAEDTGCFFAIFVNVELCFAGYFGSRSPSL
jgi:hypothetical protein